MHLAADGFLVKLPRAIDTPLAGVIRLRGLSADLLLPVDAELVPPLLPDEAAALVRQRGLVFLPGGRVLEFDPTGALPLANLVHDAAVERRPWQALPEPEELPEELTEIALEVPDTLPDDVLQPGGDGVGTESAEIPDASLPSKVAGKALFGLGKSFAWLGKSLHLPGLTAFGASLLSGAMSLAPRLSEQLLDKQEAMLRNLLRQFREGNIEEALRRALPLGDGFGRGSVPARDAWLPQHSLYYSLANLLGSRGSQGRASVWFGGGNTYNELLQEYRKQADQAAARGDFRRAAFIYGKLLRDFRSAALVLARGGLHRDAAILYERALNDLPAAARMGDGRRDRPGPAAIPQARRPCAGRRPAAPRRRRGARHCPVSAGGGQARRVRAAPLRGGPTPRDAGAAARPGPALLPERLGRTPARQSGSVCAAARPPLRRARGGGAVARAHRRGG